MADEQTQFLVGLAALAGLKLSLSYILRKTACPERSLEYVGRVSKLTVYPVKSCRGLTTEIAHIDDDGLFVIDGVHDRCIMVINGDDVFVTVRTCPTLVLVTPTVHGDIIHLDAPEMPTLKIPMKLDERAITSTRRIRTDEIPGTDCGQEAADWISIFLGRPGFRLCATFQGMPKRDMCKNKTMLGKISLEGTKAAYQDVGAIHLLSEAAVTKLNSQLKVPVTTDNFRPNIVVTGCRPNDEFDWEELYLGDVKFTTAFACERCKFPAVDPETGIPDSNTEPTKTLRRLMPYGLRNIGPILGTILKADSRGSVKVGDPVFVLRKSKITNFVF